MIDFETTGLGAGALPVEVALVEPGGTVRLATRVNPGRPIEPQAQTIHRISSRDLAQSPSMAAAARRLLAVLGGTSEVVAYHAAFDRVLWHRTLDAAQIPSPELKWHCLMERYETLRGFRTSLANACEIEGLTIRPTHSATSDALATLALLQHMASL